jgi:hypothetical protein
MLLIVRTADAHAHLCYDGKEPPVSIHLADGSSHPCESGTSSGHTGDKDVQIASDVALKKAPSVDPWITAAIPFLFQVVSSAGDPPLTANVPTPRVETIYFLRPPLRGPPA